MRRSLIVIVSLVAGLLPLTAAAEAAAAPPRNVTARVETPALYDDAAGGDADADDPAIWVDAARPGRSLVIGTAKNGGLRVYDLAGREVQAIRPPAAPGPDDEPGRFNNVDLVRGFGHVDLAVVTDRGRDQLRFYRVGAGGLVDVTAPDVPFAFSGNQAEVNEQTTAYGLATFRGAEGRAYAVVSRRHTSTVAVFALVAQGDRVTYRKVDTLALPTRFRLPYGSWWSPCAEPGEAPQVEGMIVDPATSTLYAAQEDVALWRVPLAAGRFAGSPRPVERVREYGLPATYDPATEECAASGPDPGFGGRIAADVEGVAITGRTLLVSSQGDSTFYTYDRRTLRPTGRFAVTAGRVDGAEHCDGAAVVSTPLPGYPHGLLVVHDGENTPAERPSTNFKYLDAGFLGAHRG
jgi:3-phytase